MHDGFDVCVVIAGLDKGAVVRLPEVVVGRFKIVRTSGNSEFVITKRQVLVVDAGFLEIAVNLGQLAIGLRLHRRRYVFLVCFEHGGDFLTAQIFDLLQVGDL